MTWYNEPKDDHFWAFYYFCKRLGDDVHVEHLPNNRAHLTVVPSLKYKSGG